jgi:hypothetical protein
LIRTGGAVRIKVSDADRSLVGRCGRVRLVRVVHRNLEITERLLPVMVLNGDDGPLPVEIATRLLDAPMTELDGALDAGVDAHTLDDALDELLFEETSEASRLEQPRFERTLEQIERFIGDRVLLLERQRDAAIAKLAKAQDARDNAIGAEQRGVAERALRKAQIEIDTLDDQLRALRAGDDERYRKWRHHTEARRYTPPELELVFEMELELT